MINVRTWTKIALFNFLIAAVFGAIMRFDFIREIHWMNYVHMESGHWHLALFGWIYLCIYSFLVGCFLPDSSHHQRKYDLLFWASEILILVDILCNLIYGYNFISIGLDICLLVLIGSFIFVFLSDLKKVPDTYSATVIRIALFFLAFSFSGMVFKVPLEMLFSTKRSILYYLSTQFFLHFNYNGWFTFSIFAMFFRLIENNGIQFEKAKFLRFKQLMLVTAFFTFSLSIYWGYPGHPVYLWVASGAAFVQLFAVLYIRRDFLNVFGELKPILNKSSLFLFQLAFYAYLVKLSLQAVLVVPKIAYLALTIRNYMIAYLHLMFLGVTSIFLLGYGIQQGHIRIRNNMGSMGVKSVALGLIGTEFLLVFQGTLLWMEKGFFPMYYESLFAATLLLPLGIFLVLFQVGRGHSSTGSEA